MRKTIDDLKSASETLHLAWTDIPTVENSEFAAITLATDLEIGFVESPWRGAKFVAQKDSTATIFHTVDLDIKSPRDIQTIASIFRDLCSGLEADSFACLINLDATPAMPGALGELFGFQALISIIVSNGVTDMRLRPYDASTGEVAYRGTLDSAMLTQWERSLKEPLEDFLRRLFIPVQEM